MSDHTPAASDAAEFGNLEANLQFLDRSGLLAPGRRILEIGSGRGTLLDTLRRRQLDAVGVEISGDRIAESLARYGALPIRKVEGATLPFAEATFDVVLSFDVFEHIPDTDAHLAEVSRVLKPGGWYLLQTPNKWTNTIFETIRWRSLTRWRKDHCSLHSYGELDRRLRRHGFDPRFADVQVVTPFFREKVRRHLGPVGAGLLAVVPIDRLPRRLRTNLYVAARKAGELPPGDAPVFHTTPSSARESVLGTDEEFLEALYWIVLGRPLDDEWRRTRTRQFELGHSRESMLRAVLASSEFRERYVGYHDAADPTVFVLGEEALDAGLSSLGTNGAFVDACYACLLGRDADAGGRQYYISLIEERHVSRRTIVYTILQSQEFADRYRLACPTGGQVPIDVQLCELANPAKWDNPDWGRVLQALKLPAERKLAMHRKAYEFTQTAWGLGRLGGLTGQARVLSVGAGHESLAYWLANRVKLVIATDLYPAGWESSAGSEGDARVILHPEEFAPFEYRREHLRFLQMDGTRLAFRDGAFDIAYSLSSIEHFGGWPGARKAVEEMARVVRPGGLIALATEWRVRGPSASHEGIFEPDEVRALIDMPALELVEPVDDRVWTRYDCPPVNLRLNRFETPHMLVEIDGTVFTSVMMFLRRR